MLKQLSSIRIILFIATCIIGGLFIFKFSSLPPQVPLFYSMAETDNQMADTYLIFLLPFFMYLFVIVNTFIKNKYFSQIYLIERIVYYANIAVVIVATFIFLKILLLIT